MTYINKNTYIDTWLVTCAEYQLFLDEQYTQGKYYRPDNWADYTFPSGFGHTPVLGVRLSDALAFCDWLTARDTGGWRYRLPRFRERRFEVKTNREDLRPNMGYWIEDEPFFIFSQVNPRYNSLKHFAEDIDFAHAFKCFSDLDRVTTAFNRNRPHILARAQERLGDLSPALNLDRFGDLDLALFLDLDRFLALERALVLDLNRFRVLTIDFPLNFALSSILTRDDIGARDSALSRTLDLSCDLALEIARAHDNVLSHDFVHAHEEAILTLDFILDRDQVVDLAHSLECTLADALDLTLDLYITVYLLQERIAGNFPAYEGIFIVKEPKQEFGSEEF